MKWRQSFCGAVELGTLFGPQASAIFLRRSLNRFGRYCWLCRGLFGKDRNTFTLLLLVFLLKQLLQVGDDLVELLVDFGVLGISE